MDEEVIDIFNDVLWGFEGEHIFAQQLWSDDERAEFLETLGYERDMLGNLMGLFADQETVDRLQALPAQHPLRILLMDPNSGFGITVTVHLFPWALGRACPVWGCDRGLLQCDQGTGTIRNFVFGRAV